VSEMVERVARAMAANDYDRIFKCAPRPAPHRKEWIDGFWENHAALARAAIEAMREPTPLMKMRGANQLTGYIADALAPVVASDVLDAMIEAAISEAPQAGA